MIQISKTKGVIVAVIVGVIAFRLAFNQRQVHKPTPIVSIENGRLQGKAAYSRAGNEYMEFLGIPYAEPPVGELRFESPVPLKRPWTGVKQAVEYPPHCAQCDVFATGKVEGSEDCLYLNVFTYGILSDKKKPVLVYIHGGGFVQGTSSLYRPSFFMDEDIVLVAMNYRVGPLGFMNAGDDLIRGNMGLKDQNLALKWVQRNIEKFGGDPSQVTLFGTSAGAVSVHYHMISPLSRGLFHKALSQSGVVTCPWGFERNPKRVLMEYVKSLNCPTENMNVLVDCLKRMDATELVKHQSSSLIPKNDLFIFVPSVETVLRDDTFLHEDPEVILSSGNFSKVPFMLGVTSGEGGLRTSRFDAMPEYIAEIDQAWEKSGHVAICDDELEGNTEVLHAIRKLYFDDANFTDSFYEFKKNFTLLNSDAMFFEPTHTAALHHAKAGAPTCLYYYDYDPPTLPSIYSILRAVRPDDWIFAGIKVLWTLLVDHVKRNYLGSKGAHDFGVTHGNDLLQIWDIEGTGNLLGNDTEFSMNFISTIVSYARNEEPLQFGGVVWPPLQIKDAANPSFKYMLLDKEAKIIDEPFAHRMPFWKSIRQRKNGNLQRKRN